MPEQTVNPVQEVVLADVEGVSRVRDLDVAERLGFERPRNIRKLITRHRSDLERFGPICSIWSKPGRVGRPSEEFWLNEDQAVFITAKSDTPTAADVTVMVVRLFTAWRRGHLEPKGAITELGPDVRKVLGGVVKSVVHSEIAIALQELLPSMVRDVVGASQFGIVHGLTAGSVLDMAGVKQRKGLKGAASWVSRRLERFHYERGVSPRPGSLGLLTAKMFEPTLCREWLSRGGRTEIEQYVSQRRGQTVLKLVQR